MERIDFVADKYSTVEASIHLTRYATAFPYVKGKRVLDAACGEGYGSALMKRHGAKSVVGVDISDEAIKAAKELFAQDDLEYIVHDAEQLPFTDASFDMAVSFETVEHLDNPLAFLSELRRVVKSGGTIIVSCPNDHYYSESVPGYSNPFHKKRYTFFDFREMAESVFGKTDNWFLGNALAGFFNMPLEDCTYPESQRPEAPENMLAMMDAKRLSEIYMVPPEKYLNNWNSLYYIGVWGDRKTENNACVYPTPHFFLYQNKTVPESMQLAKEYQKAYQLLEQNCEEEAKARKNEYQALEEKYKEICNQLADHEQLKLDLQHLRDESDRARDEYRVLTNERDRLYLMNDMQKKEELLLWDQVHRLRDENKKLFEEHLLYFGLKEAYEKQEDQLHSLLEENQKLKEQHELLFDEHLKYYGLLEAYEAQQNWIAETKKSRGWRFLEMIHKVLHFFGWR